MDPKNVEPVLALKELRPKNLGQVRRLVGLLSVYRRFVPNFARLAKPLYSLLKVEVGEGSRGQKESESTLISTLGNYIDQTKPIKANLPN